MPIDGRPVDVVVLGLAGFRVLAAREIAGEVELTVETTADVVGCPACGVRAVAKHRRTTLLRDGS